jgi:hypothetical protein
MHGRLGVQLRWFLHWAVDKLKVSVTLSLLQPQNGSLCLQGAWRVPNLVGPRNPDNFMRPSNPDNFMGRFVGPRALQDAVILTTDVPPPRWQAEFIIDVKYWKGGTKDKDKYITSNLKHEAGVLCNLYYKMKINLRYRKHGRRNDFDRNLLMNLDLPSISNYTKIWR